MQVARFLKIAVIYTTIHSAICVHKSYLDWFLVENLIWSFEWQHWQEFLCMLLCLLAITLAYLAPNPHQYFFTACSTHEGRYLPLCGITDFKLIFTATLPCLCISLSWLWIACHASEYMLAVACPEAWASSWTAGVTVVTARPGRQAHASHRHSWLCSCLIQLRAEGLPAWASAFCPDSDDLRSWALLVIIRKQLQAGINWPSFTVG